MRWVGASIAFALVGVAACASFGSSDGPFTDPTPPEGAAGTSSSSSTSSTSSTSSGAPADSGAPDVTGPSDQSCVVTLSEAAMGTKLCGTTTTQAAWPGTVVPADTTATADHGSAFCGTGTNAVITLSLPPLDCGAFYFQSGDPNTSAAIQGVIPLVGATLVDGQSKEIPFTTGGSVTVTINAPTNGTWKLLAR